MNALERVLDTFEWSRGDGQPLGEITWEPGPSAWDPGRLCLVVWVRDNNRPEVDEVKPLLIHRAVSGRALVDEDAARVEVREIIHWWLCHEADEQMRFDGERPFYPHDENGLTISVR